ncbi:hypothetical protein, partial [Streptomyces sp. NPDC059008]|uniref:hypothetical protein n=1 Tax=Streptomyces sp. NPDC059008 TaxID=3346693 RepID=UPI0036C33DD9
ARLRSRFGRAWRRKAPVESLMPLRLARYGVPLAETAPAGLAAAGIEPQVLPAPEQSAAPALEPRAQEPAEAQGPTDAPKPAEAEDLPNQWFAASQQVTYQGDYDPTYVPEQAEADLADAFHAYTAQHGHSPNARQFALYLADHGITDPETGGPLSEAVLRPALQEQRREHPTPTDVVEPKPEPEPEQWQMTGTGHPAYSSVADHASANTAVADAAPFPEPLATASATTGQRTHHTVSSDTGQSTTGHHAAAHAADPSAIPPAREPDTVGRPELWEAAALDSGEATARQPQPQQQELDPEAQRIEQVVQWLIEAEDTGKKLSGAEVARRLEVAPRTGQRVVAAARELKDARERENSQRQGRAHLRSVTHRK